MTELECPKCHSPMRRYERSSRTIDQCTGCRGVFLDRGERDRLIDAEGAYYERAAPPPPPGPPPVYERQRPAHHGGHGHHGKRKKKSFLDEFLDFG